MKEKKKLILNDVQMESLNYYNIHMNLKIYYCY